MSEQVNLTEAQIDQIAERAARKAVAQMTGLVYQEVGKTVVKRFFWIVGLLAVGMMAGYQHAEKIFR